jgi:hypothetical protein
MQITKKKEAEPSEQQIIDRAIWVCDRIIVRYLETQKASQAGKDLPYEIHRQILQNKFTNRFDCALWILEQEGKDEPRQQPAA